MRRHISQNVALESNSQSSDVQGSSDDGKSVSQCKRRWRIKRLYASVAALFFVIVLNVNRILPPPELVLTNTFTAEEHLPRIPPQCQDLAKKFYQCQSSAKDTAVFACHRRWCHGSGHCTPCGGIGDRTRSLMSQIQESAQKCRRVALDYPLDDIAILDSAVYKDPSGWWGEIFHFRSYDISKRIAPVWIDNDDTTEARVQHSHFQPIKGHAMRAVDPCYYHLLFAPTASFQRDLDRHTAAIGDKAISIHFRTGDATAFGITNEDTRVKQVEVGWNKMLECADQLVDKLFDSRDGVTYFLATDNAELKATVQKEQKEGTEQRRIYTTEARPHSYLRGLSVDRDAWMEIYLLGGRKGMVVNVRPKDYQGTAGKLSFFSVLAKNIGFLSDSQVMECHLDED